MIRQIDTREKIAKRNGKTMVEDHFGCLRVTMVLAQE